MSSNFLNTFNSDEIEVITALIDKLEKSSFDYMKLESDGMSITIGKNGVDGSVAGNAALHSAGAAAAPSSYDTARIFAADESISQAAPPEKKYSIPEQEGVYIIKSLSYGLFYAQSEPGAPPYVTVGSAIQKDDTIGLMEIMKTFTAITSPVTGEVIAIHVKNEETLEPGQPLVSVRISL